MATLAQAIETAMLAAQHVMRPAPPAVPAVRPPAAPVHLPDGKRELVRPDMFFAAVRAMAIRTSLNSGGVALRMRVLSLPPTIAIMPIFLAFS